MQDFTAHTDTALAKIQAASAVSTREERIIRYHCQQILNILDHKAPRPYVPADDACPDCLAPAHELCYANCPRFAEDPE